MTDINDELSRCAITLLMREPFLAHLLSGISRKVTASVPTLAVGLCNGQVQLYINEDFFINGLKTLSSRVAVLKHEVLHLLFKHLERHVPHRDSELCNLAADLVVNQYIGTWKLPDNAVVLSCFPDLKLEPERELEYYYGMLTALSHEMRQQGWCPDDSDDSGRQTTRSTGDSLKHGGALDGGNGWELTSSPLSAVALERIFDRERHGDHSLWDAEAPDNLNGFDIAGTQFERLVIQAWERCTPKQRTSISGPLYQSINALIEQRKPQCDWRRILRRFACSGRRTQISSTMRRPSKRFHTFPGLRIKRFQKLAVIVDTSGSIEEDELDLFFSEIYGIWRTGAEIIVIESDDVVQRTYPYKGQPPEKIGGGGGTDFNSGIAWLNQSHRQPFDACIYLTDGCAPELEIRPCCRLLWVVTANGNIGTHLTFGQVVKLAL